jgi:hypothetical protein
LLFKEQVPLKFKKEISAVQCKRNTFWLISLSTPVSCRWIVPLNSGVLYEDGILFTLQLLYYRNWVSRINTHTENCIMEHTESRIMEHTESLFSVLKVVTHTHPTIPNMFIPP